jgi:murein DD-endopeptidase MepM/ murein hydrolase activator NlpD
MNPADLSRALGSLFTWPVRGRISSYFGQRADPWSGLPSLHTGVDIVSATGTAVGAAMTGTVRRVGFNPTFGNFVILQHSGGWQTLYGHLARWTVKLGQKVAQGEKIGELGATGHVTGAHLHLSFFRSGQLVDPLKYLK